MAHEIDTAARLAGHDVAGKGSDEVTLTASPLSRKMQAVGQRIMGHPRLVQVQPGVFSTCQEPIDTLAARLVRARDTGVTLVEVTMFPRDDKNDAVRQLFGTSDLIRSIMRSDGVEHPDHFNGKVIRAESVHLPTFANDAIAPSSSEVTTSRASNYYYNYDNGEIPGSGGSYTYEESLGYGLVPANRSGINLALDRMLDDFTIAIMRDGSIEGTMVSEEIVRGQLNPGQ